MGGAGGRKGGGKEGEESDIILFGLKTFGKNCFREVKEMKVNVEEGAG